MFPPNIDQLAARHLHNRGIEMTPDQVRTEFDSALDTIRHEMGKKGFAVPDDEREFMLLLKDALSYHQCLSAFPTTPEEVAAVEEVADDKYMPSDEEFDRMWAKISSVISSELDVKQPFAVICPLGGVIQRYEYKSDAVQDAAKRNRRAVTMGLSARYTTRDCNVD